MPDHQDDSDPSSATRRRLGSQLPGMGLALAATRAIGSLKLPASVSIGRLELFKGPVGIRPMLPSLRRARIEMPVVAAAGPQQMVEASEALAKAGWFFDPDTPYKDFRDAGAALGRGDASAADALMAEHFERRAPEIEARLARAFPDRAGVLSQAFAAHARGEYALSVLAFLSQADGLSAKLRGGHFFLRAPGPKGCKKKRQTAAYVLLRDKGGFDRVRLAALEIELPIAASGSRRAADGSLNRHAVLHGESSDYGSKLNSLKGMSLVNYVAFGADTREAGEAG